MSRSVEQTNQPVSPNDGIDRDALVLAGLGTVVTLVLAVGDWTPWSSLVGLTFLAITWALHHGAPTTRTPRSALMRIAFGSVSALCVFLAAGWPLGSILLLGDRHGWVRAMIWLVLAAAISFWEPRISRWLDRERQR